MILHIPRCKLTCPVKIDGCKMKSLFKNGPFLGDMLIFRGIYIYINIYIYISIYINIYIKLYLEKHHEIHIQRGINALLSNKHM